MNTRKFYLQPLGLLRGCGDSEHDYPSLAGQDLYFSAVRVIKRSEQGIDTKIIPCADFDNYLKTLENEDVVELNQLMTNMTLARQDIILSENHQISFNLPIIQGILNVTPDSFSDGGLFDNADVALDHAKAMMSDGANIIDIGGETTKPGAQPVPEDVEKERVLPVIKTLAGDRCLISIDSRNASVMKAALDAGAQIINDVSALEHDPKSIEVAAKSAAPVILMHAQGNPDVMQNDPKYNSAVLDIYDYLAERINHCERNGIERAKIIVDPGIGFGKTVDHNLEILANISIFHGLGVPILIGISRKSFIGKVTGEDEPDKRVSGSIAAAQQCLEQGVQILRVHDVEETANAIAVYSAISAKSAMI